MTEPLPILILPSWRYHATQGGKIFRTQAELEEAEAQGWRAPYGGTPKEGGTRRAPGAAERSEEAKKLSADSFPAAVEAPIVEVQKVITVKRKR